MTSQALILDKSQVGRSFSRAAVCYDGVAELQRRVGEELLRFSPMQDYPSAVVDVGAGTGYCTSRLRVLFPQAQLIALDIAEGMLVKALERPQLRAACWPLCADAESLPLRDASVDVLFSNLALQWCPDLPTVLAEFSRVLRPGGRLLFSTFGESTLMELRAAWARVDAYTHVNTFLAREQIERALKAAGFVDDAVSKEPNLLDYTGVDALMHELKTLGAHNVTAHRPRQLTGKTKLQNMVTAYQEAMGDGRIRATFEIIKAVARRPISGD